MSKHVLRKAAEVGDAGEVRAFAAGKLQRQAFLDRLVGHDVDDDGRPGVLGLELLDLLGPGVALGAVLVAGEAQFGGSGRRNDAEDGCGHAGKKMCSVHEILPGPGPDNVRRSPI